MVISDFVNSLLNAFREIGTDMQFKADLVNGKVPLVQLPSFSSGDISGDFIPLIEKGAANGVATLDGGTKINSAQLPATALTSDIPLTQKGALNGVATLDGSGKVPAGQLPALGGGTGTGEMTLPNFVDHFGGNANGVANNDAAFIAAEASAFQRIWLPKGRYITSKDPLTLFKRYEGSGTIQFTTVDNVYYRPRTNSRVYKKVFPTSASNTVNIGTNEPLAQDFGEIEYLTIPPGSRSDLDPWALTANPPNGRPAYYWTPSYGHSTFYISNGGESGYNGLLAANASAGATSATIQAGVVGWNVGDIVEFMPVTGTYGGFPSIPAATIFGGDRRTITSVDVTNARISWSGGLVNSYTTGMVVTKGYRTMNTAYFVQVEGGGGGDHAAYLARGRLKHTVLASEPHYSASVVTLYGGDIESFSNYNGGIGWEVHYSDKAFSSTMIGFVNAYTRQKYDGSRGMIWIHDFCQMPYSWDQANTLFVTPNAGGAYPMDCGYCVKLQARTGIDMTDSRFSIAAIALPINEKICFFANKTWLAADATNGNGFVATKGGGNIHGGVGPDGTDELVFTIHQQGGGGTAPNQILLRQNGLQTYLDLAVPIGKKIGWGILNAGSPMTTYFTFNGSNVQLVVNGAVRATW